MASLSKDEIIAKLHAAGDEFVKFCGEIETAEFFRQPGEKWSIAQNVEHLTISANKTRLPFILPKFIVRYYTGKPNRASRSYDDLVNKYKSKLQQGGKASGVFIPDATTGDTGSEKILADFFKSMTRLIKAIKKHWRDEQLDSYLAPHPLLGKITLRELGYFTIYHTYHHLYIIRRSLEVDPAPNF